MFIEHLFYIGLSDINASKELTNTCLLRHLEDAAGLHSEIAGYGISDIERTRKSWILLSWKVEIRKRPLVNDTLNIRTWSRKIDKFYAYRDFEVKDQYNNILCVATSKWVFMDIDKMKIQKVGDEVAEKYKQEPEFHVFEEEDIEKLVDPENYISSIDFKITRNMIDINKHLHNTYYSDIAKEALPEDVYNDKEMNNFIIMYKKEIKLGDTVKAYYSKINDDHIVTIKGQDGTLHAIIKLN